MILVGGRVSIGENATILVRGSAVFMHPRFHRLWLGATNDCAIPQFERSPRVQANIGGVMSAFHAINKDDGGGCIGLARGRIQDRCVFLGRKF